MKMRLAWFCEFSSAGWAYPPPDGPYGHGYDYRNVDFYVDAARGMERGMFDMVIAADTSAVHRYQGSMMSGLRHGMGCSYLSPQLAMAAMAAVTKNLGFVPTMATNVFPPYLLAREMATLDNLSGGRAGWNIVTSIADEVAQNFGIDELLSRDERYDQADEYVAVVEKLWDSWDADAIVMDRENWVFARPGSVREINHQGRWYKVRGPLNTPRGPQGRPLYLQAGASPRGMDFAARHADAVIAHGNSVEAMKHICSEIKGRAEKFGRDPASVKVFFTTRPFIGRSTAEAHAKREHLRGYMMEHSDLAMWIYTVKSGLDIEKLPLDEPLRAEQFEGLEQGIQGMFHQYYAEGSTPTLREVVAMQGMNETFQLVGTPAEIVDRIVEAQEESGFDGLAIQDRPSVARVTEIVDTLVPELQRRGLMRTQFRHKTLRENFFDDEA